MDDVDAALESLQWAKESFQQSRARDRSKPKETTDASDTDNESDGQLEIHTNIDSDNDSNGGKIEINDLDNLVSPNSMAGTGGFRGDQTTKIAELEQRLKIATERADRWRQQAETLDATGVLDPIRRASDIERYQAQVKTLRKELWSARKEVEEWKLKEAGGRAEIVALRSSNSRLKSRLKEAEQLKDIVSKDSSDNGEKIEELKVALEIAKRELTHAEDEVADLRMVCIKGDSETANFKEKIKSLEQDNIKLERQLQEQLELTRRSKSVKNRSRKNFIPDSDSDDLDSDEDRSVGATTFSRQMNNPHAFRSPTSKAKSRATYFTS